MMSNDVFYTNVWHNILVDVAFYEPLLGRLPGIPKRAMNNVEMIVIDEWISYQFQWNLTTRKDYSSNSEWFLLCNNWLFGKWSQHVLDAWGAKYGSVINNATTTNWTSLFCNDNKLNEFVFYRRCKVFFIWGPSEGRGSVGGKGPKGPVFIPSQTVVAGRIKILQGLTKEGVLNGTKIIFSPKHYFDGDARPHKTCGRVCSTI